MNAAPTTTALEPAPAQRAGVTGPPTSREPASLPSGRTHPTLGHYLAFTLAHPQAALADLVVDPRGRRFAAVLLGIVAVLYSLVEWFLYRQHYDPVPPPFLRIPTDQYYAWATLFCVPAFLGGWLLATGAMQLGARAFGGHGRFEDLATAVAWAIGVATLFTLVPDFLSSALGVYATWDPTGHTWVVTSSLYLIAYAVLYSSALRTVHGLGWRSGYGLGLGGVALYHAFFLLFVR